MSGKCFRGDQVLFFRFVTLSVESLIHWPVREKPDKTVRDGERETEETKRERKRKKREGEAKEKKREDAGWLQLTTHVSESDISCFEQIDSVFRPFPFGSWSK